MEQYANRFSVKKMCRCLEVSRSGYYLWLKRSRQPQPVRKRLSIDESIRQIWLASNKRYGAPKIRIELIKKGIMASRPRIQRRMQAMNIRCRYRRAFRITTDSQHSFPIAENLLAQQFNPTKLSQAWISDITYLRHKTGWLYLTMVMDLADRQIIGWALSSDLSTASTVLPAFRMASQKRHPAKHMIFHSDRGCQYASDTFRRLLADFSIRQSMSRKGNCWDNAVAESFFKTLKAELPIDYAQLLQRELHTAIFEFIEIWYNRQRIHASLTYKTPCEKECELKQVA